MQWTEEKIETMRKLLAEGKSCSHIAALFITTKSAIIGKVHRLEAASGEKWKRSAGRTYGARKKAARKPAAVSLAVLKLKRPLPLAATPGPIQYVPGVPVGILDATGCRWPVDMGNVPGRHLFCNNEIHKGSYCRFHAHESVAHYSRKLILKTTREAMRAYER